MLYQITKTFKGSQDGRHTETFEAGTVADLSDYLAACAPENSIRMAGSPAATIEIDNKAIATDGDKPRRARK